MLYRIADTYRDEFSLYNTSDVMVAADNPPSGLVIVNGTDSNIPVTISTTAIAGRYKVSAPLSSGVANDDICYATITASVGAKVQMKKLDNFRVDTSVNSRLPASGIPVNFTSMAITAGGAVTAGTVSDKTGYSLSQSFPSNFSSFAITAAGKVTVGTNDDKTGYALSPSGVTVVQSGLATQSDIGNVQNTADDIGQDTDTLLTRIPSVLTITTGKVDINDKTGFSLSQSFPSNFSSLAISGGGAVTAGTVSDKTGYSLSQSFPSNFSSLAISVAGKITVGTNDDKTGYELSSTGITNVQSGLATQSDTDNLQNTVDSISQDTGTLISRIPSAITLPTNFSSLAITAGGATTVGTNNDKTGYTLSGGGVTSVQSGLATSVALSTLQTTATSNNTLLTDSSYGLSKLVRATTPANTLDIDVDGKVDANADVGDVTVDNTEVVLLLEKVLRIVQSSGRRR